MLSNYIIVNIVPYYFKNQIFLILIISHKNCNFREKIIIKKNYKILNIV